MNACVCGHSYWYGTPTVYGYQDASCVMPTVAPGPAVCTGLWSETGVTGVFMNVVNEAGMSTWDTWWAGMTADIDYATQHNDTDLHAVELVTVNGVSTATSCKQNVSLYVRRLRARAWVSAGVWRGCVTRV